MRREENHDVFLNVKARLQNRFFGNHAIYYDIFEKLGIIVALKKGTHELL